MLASVAETRSVAASTSALPFTAQVPPSEVRVEPQETEHPAPPKGVVCSIRGSGRPVQSNCGDSEVVVSEGRFGKNPLARVRLEGLSLTWGIFRGTGPAWIHAEDANARISGFAPTTEQMFTVTTEIPVLPDHVWLLEEAPVKIARGIEDGLVEVSLSGDMIEGVDDLKWKLSCDALGYDPLPNRGVSSSRVRATGSRAAPTGPKLRLRTQPGEEPFATLKSSSERLGLALEVVSVLGDFTRVRFFTSHARFDVWVASKEIDRSGLGFGFGRRSGVCVSRGTVTPVERALIVEDTSVTIGRNQQRFTAPSVELVAGAEVSVVKREAGFALVVPQGRIQPSDGVAFFVPESVLGPPRQL
ncbi:MAG: hypothetical protein HOV80_11695 [Polyangiaceae bacterium]|nr:hypothetical protein [Polyangiaceae bacterium]